MSIIDRIREQLDMENPRLIISFGDVETMTLEDVAYASVFDWVELSDDFKGNEYIRFDSGCIYIKSIDFIKNINILLLLASIKTYYRVTIYIINNNYNGSGDEYDLLCEYDYYVFDKSFLEDAWKYAIDNGLSHLDFGQTIKHLDYKIPTKQVEQKHIEFIWDYLVKNDLDHSDLAKFIKKREFILPKSDLYHLWLSKLSPRQVKSARKN